MPDDELAEQSPGERAEETVLTKDRALCSEVQKIVNTEGSNKTTTWHCKNCNSIFSTKKEERKHAYWTNVWLRKKAALVEGKTEPAKSTKKRKVEVAVSESVSPVEADDGSRPKKVHRGRRGGVMHPKMGPCRNWAKGKCLRGVRCKFTHEAIENGEVKGEAVSRVDRLKNRVGGREAGGTGGECGEGRNGDDLLLAGHEGGKSRSVQKKKGLASSVRKRTQGEAAPPLSSEKEGKTVKVKKRKMAIASSERVSEVEIKKELESDGGETPGRNSAPSLMLNGIGKKPKSKVGKGKVVDEKPLILL